jgi:ribonucleoside-diphosphate reductase alpha chain
VARSATEAESLEDKRGHGGGRDFAHEAAAHASPLDAQLDAMMGDAPVCDVCGHITVRNGACYKCLNCGNSMGCS